MKREALCAKVAFMTTLKKNGLGTREGRLVFGAFALLCLVWGCNWTVMSLANGYFPPILFSAWRFGTAAVIMAAAVLILRKKLPPRRTWPWIAVTGFLQIAYGNGVMQYCLTGLDSGLTAVLSYTMPLFVAVLAPWLLKERMGLGKILGILVTIAGLAIVMKAEVSGSLWFVMVALSSAFAWGLSNILLKLKLRGCDLLAVTAGQMAVGALCLAGWCAATEQGSMEWTPGAVACLAYNAALASALAFSLWNFVLSRMEASKASVASLAVPAVGVLSGVVFLGEPLTASMMAGMLLILGGICAVQKAK